jgi:acyl transferase domain-containing protein/NADPH:quinone reductase-like Zn-dependent oxidoreductase/acyl carrier protein
MNDPIAIVGIGCRFPGDANDPNQLWSVLARGQDAIVEVPADRWSARTYFHPDPDRPGRTYARWGGYLRDVDHFDAQFFSISPREAAKADPQQRLLLEVAAEALEDAGLTAEGVNGSKCGVFVGISSYDYGGLQCSPDERRGIDAYTNLGSALSIAANRISYAFNLKGPSLAVDTACSSSLVAAHLACRSLWNGETDLALTGGVSLMLRPEPTIGFSKASMLARDGRCKSFDAAADGYARAEGVGVLVLKRLADAQADGDAIYAVIRATAVNQDGRTPGISVPNARAQEALVRAALADAGIAPESVQYVEAHGTGTPVGDPIEASALGGALGANRPAGSYCLIGSIKSNFGHPEAAAGVAGLIKTALAIQRGQIPPNLHFTNPNPQIPFEDLRLRVVDRLMPWPDTAGAPRRAGVNSFGFGGTNAHVLLESAPAPAAEPACSHDARAQLVPLSARSPEALRALAEAYVPFLAADGAGAGASIGDIGHAAALRRSHHDQRLALVARTPAELQAQLRAFLADESRSTTSVGRKSARKGPVFVCSGMGQQWWSMGRQLLAQEPTYRASVERIDALLRARTGWSVLDELLADETQSRIDQTHVAQPAIFATQVALADLWAEWGVHPEAVVGHSVGEVAAACIAGALSLEDAVEVVFHRSRLQQLTAGQGSMLAVGLPLSEARHLIAGREMDVSLAAVNSPRSVTLSGATAVLQEIAAVLDARGTFNRFLQVEVPYHSPSMDPLRGALLDALHALRPRSSSRPLYSTVRGQLVDGVELDAEYWWRNVRDTVLFDAALVGLMEGGYDVFLEIGAHPVLSVAIAESLAERQRSGAAVQSLRRGEAEERATLLGSLGRLYTLGVEPDWQRVHPRRGTFVKLPAYPWQHERFWHESDATRQTRLAEQVHPLLGARVESAQPRWTFELDLAGLPMLGDHRLQEAVVFPAAGYVEMGLAATRELFGAGPCVVEDVSFRRAMFVPEKTHLQVEVQVDPTRHTFEVSSRSPGPTDKWVTNAGGKLRPLPAPPRPVSVPLEEIRQRCPTALGRAECYERFHSLGLEYGPAFRGIERLWFGDREAVAELRPHDDASDQLGGAEYRLHPGLLDSAFQTLLWTLVGDRSAAADGVRFSLPVRMGRLVYHAAPVGPRLWVYARLVDRTATSFAGDLVVLDAGGACVAEIQGFACAAIDRATAAGAGALYEYQWHPQPRASATPVVRSASHLPGPGELAPALREQAGLLRTRWARETFHGECRDMLRELAVAYVMRGLRQLGWDAGRDAGAPIDEVAERLGVVPEHRRYFARLVTDLSPGELAGEHDPDGLWKQVWHRHPGVQAELQMVRPCGTNLADVLRGRIDPLTLIFPEGSAANAEHLYQDSPSYRVYNLLVQQAIRDIAAAQPPGRTLRILEIGGGTGGLTAYVLPTLDPLKTHYTFTDIAPLLVSQAEQNFRSHRFVEYDTLDIEADPIAQGLERHGYDVVLASDVLHATADLRGTLEHVKTLLASDGVLVLSEGVHAELGVILMFGMLKGWWLFRDTDLRADDPWIPREAWQRLLVESGFSDPASISDVPHASHAVVLARGPRIEGGPTDEAARPDAAGSWLIFGEPEGADRRSLGAELSALLRQRGAETLLVFPGDAPRDPENGRARVRPGHPEDLQRLLEHLPIPLAGLRGIVHLWSLAAEPPEEAGADEMTAAWRSGLMSVVGVVQALGASGGALPGLWVVTRNAQMVDVDGEGLNVASSPLWGLGRVVANEYPQLRCHTLDLGAGDADELDGLVAELLSEGNEDELALRGEARYVRRLVQVADAGAMRLRRHADSAQAFRLQAQVPGLLDSLSARAISRTAPGPGQVEVEVVAAALNFKDVTLAMALLPPEALRGGFSGGLLGLEYAGRVVAVGPDVERLREGDAVFGCGSGCLSSHITVDQHMAVPIPAGLGFEEAATIPVAFVTAVYALHTLAAIQPGERVLIHAATGGVGLAAVQVAQAAGAEVFATAGSPAKRELLRTLGVRHVMDSRSLAFADEVLEATGGEGVDVVLNSLSGEALPKSLSLLRAYGRFVEIGKRDIYENRALGMEPFGENVSFFAVDLDRVGAQRPGLMNSLLQRAAQLLAEGRVHPLSYRVFPVTRMGTAMRHLAQAKHVGKVVIAMQEHAGLEIAPAGRRLRLEPNGTYLVTGGLGGFGLAVARWLAELGARHLVLLGRGGAATPEAQAAVRSLQQDGVAVTVAACDVTDEWQLAELLASIRRGLPPLRGVVHAAMVLDDALLQDMTEERMWRALLPKALGAWNLHRLTLDDPLDLFVLFSSFTSLIGNPGQANYVAGNTFLDTLAHHRWRRGRPALAVNWGGVSGVGYVARNRAVAERAEQVGMKLQPVQQLLAGLTALLEHGVVQAGVADVDWRRIRRLFGPRQSPRFSKLIGDLGDDSGPLEDTSVHTILNADPAERAALLVQHIRTQLATVLGISPAKLDPDQSMLTLGLDSLMAVEMRNRVQMEMGVDIPPVKFMEGVSITDLAAFVAERLAVQHPSATRPTGQAAPASDGRADAEAAAEDVLDRLSDEEVDQRLRELVSGGGG